MSSYRGNESSKLGGREKERDREGGRKGGKEREREIGKQREREREREKRLREKSKDSLSTDMGTKQSSYAKKLPEAGKHRKELEVTVPSTHTEPRNDCSHKSE
jgi:hypothetical protein